MLHIAEEGAGEDGGESGKTNRVRSDLRESKSKNAARWWDGIKG